jgi:hypothetical protein
MKLLIQKRILAGILCFQLILGLYPFPNPNNYSFIGPIVVQAAASQIIYVPSQGNLQSAINSISNGGVIEISPGTYPVPVNGYILNELHKGFKIRAQSGGQVILDGGGAQSILRFQNTAVVNGGWITFEGITFANGRSDTPGLAAGVTMSNAQGTFLNCFFNTNYAGWNGAGGGILVASNSTALFVNSIWQNNTAATHGAGMAVADHSKVYIHNSQFNNNRVNLPGHTDYAAGGGIHVGNSYVRISNTLFEGNLAGYVGGGVFAIGTWGDSWTTDVIVTNSTFNNNKAVSDPAVHLPYPTEGGAIHVEAQAVGKIYNSRFITNSADNGGAITLYLSTLFVEGSVFLGNQAVGTNLGGFGGAISGNSNDTPADGSTNRPLPKLR